MQSGWNFPSLQDPKFCSLCKRGGEGQHMWRQHCETMGKLDGGWRGKGGAVEAPHHLPLPSPPPVLPAHGSLTWPCPWPRLGSGPPLAPPASQLRSGPGAGPRSLQCGAHGTPPTDGGKWGSAERAEKMVPEEWEGKDGEWTGCRKQGVGSRTLGRVHRERLPGYLTLLCTKRVILSGG